MKWYEDKSVHRLQSSDLNPKEHLCEVFEMLCHTPMDVLHKRAMLGDDTM